MEDLGRRARLILALVLGLGGCAKPEPLLLPAPSGGGVDSIRVALPPGYDGARPTAERKTITFIAGNARDLLDGGVDALLTDDPALLEYAAARPRTLATLTLPWSRTYGVLAAVPLPVTDSAAFRDQLARDAVSGGARGAALPAWWREAGRCSPSGPAEPPSASRAVISDRIIYAASDRHAQELAERLAALGARLRAVGLDEAGFGQALASGNDFAYILATPSRSEHPCQELSRLRPPLAPGHLARLMPLVETRWHLIVRRGRFGVSVDSEGTPQFR